VDDQGTRDGVHTIRDSCLHLHLHLHVHLMTLQYHTTSVQASLSQGDGCGEDVAGGRGGNGREHVIGTINHQV